jgi:hypothetical protein
MSLADIAGLPLNAAFRKVVLEDEDFRSLAAVACRADPCAIPILLEGQFPRAGQSSFQWPVDLAARVKLTDVINDGAFHFEKRKKVGFDSESAWTALRGRYQRLIDSCVAIGVQGTYVASGHFGPINPAELHRSSAWIDWHKGDLLEETEQKLIARWTGLSILPVPQMSQAHSDVSHVKPPNSDHALSVAVEHSKPKKSVARQETKISSVRQFREWLTDEMKKSPNKKIGVKDDWFEKAKLKWPDLSERAFLDGWEHAIGESRAASWATPGRRPKQ